MANSGDGVLQRVCLLRGGVMGFERAEHSTVGRVCSREFARTPLSLHSRASHAPAPVYTHVLYSCAVARSLARLLAMRRRELDLEGLLYRPKESLAQPRLQRP